MIVSHLHFVDAKVLACWHLFASWRDFFVCDEGAVYFLTEQSVQDLTAKPFSSLTHSCCFSLVLMWPSSSSSLCSFWHRFLCWPRKRKTVTLRSKTNRDWNKQGWKKQSHPTPYMTKKRTHLLSAALCCSISFSKLVLCSIKLSMFWRQSFSSSLEKRNTKEQRKVQLMTQRHIPDQNQSEGTFSGLFMCNVFRISG